MSKKAKIIVHISRTDGHRIGYADTFGAVLGAKVTEGSIFSSRLAALIKTPQLILATIDDDYLGFIFLTLFRGILGKKTVAIFLRPEQCFLKTRRVIYYSKKAVFRALKYFPNVSILTIVPHSIRPNYRLISNSWIYDPEFWDLWTVGCPKIPATKFSNLITESTHREKLIFVGSLARRKGASQLLDYYEKNNDKVSLIVAGRVEEECRDISKRLRELGAIIEDRFVSNQELLSLYYVADYVWCIYSPEYDQSSGVLGRALQLGKTVLVRKDSIAYYLGSGPINMLDAVLSA